MRTRTAHLLAWSVNWTCCAYIAWAVYVVKTRVPVFGSLFAGLGVGAVPRATMTLVDLSKGLVPVAVGGALILLLVWKEVVLASPGVRALISVLVFIVVAWSLQWIALSLLQPLYQTLQKIGS